MSERSGRTRTVARGRPCRAGGILATGLFVLTVGLVPAPALAQSNIDPDDAGFRYAWSENAGWLNARPLGPLGPGILVSDFELTGWLWAENLGWISLSCRNRGTCGTVAYGVLNDGQGQLSGFAWAENAGWIDFGPSGAGVTIDPSSGTFAGHAWGENIGWIAFRGTGTVPLVIETAWRCFPAPPPPAGIPRLDLDRAPEGTWLSWSAIPLASAYDVVRGDLRVLATTGGDFSLALTGCEARRTAAPSLLTTLDPSPAEGIFYLVRAANCGAAGTYDSGGPGQAGSRDGEIASSPARCP